MISGTITDASGRTLSGQTTEAFWNSIRTPSRSSSASTARWARPLSRPHLRACPGSPTPTVSVYPNAGLPNAFGDYDETPEDMAGVLRDFAAEGLVNIVGGCCGTTPAHIRAIAEAVRECAAARDPADRAPHPPERTGTARHRPRHQLRQRRRAHQRHRFTPLRQADPQRRLRDRRSTSPASRSRTAPRSSTSTWTRACSTPRRPWTRFLNLIAAEPDIARVPVMIDSSKWSVIEAGLKCVQGKSVVNSISLKEGEAEFIRQARLARRYGAAVIVMAFDEEGQADTVERKVDICRAPTRS